MNIVSGLYVVFPGIQLMAQARDLPCNAWLAESTLPGVGRGVFAGRAFSEGEPIAVARPARAPDATIGSSQLSSYGFDVDPAETKHGSRVMLGVSPFINAASLRFANVHYAQYILHDPKDLSAVVAREDQVVASRDIDAGEELFYSLDKTRLTAFNISFFDLVGAGISTRRAVLDISSAGATCLTDIIADKSSERVVANYSMEKGESFVSPIALLAHESIENGSLLSQCCFGSDVSSGILALPLGIPGNLVHSDEPNLAYKLEALGPDGTALDDNLWDIAGSAFLRVAMRFTVLRSVSVGDVLTVDRGRASREHNDFWPAHWSTSLMSARLEAATLGDVRAQFQHAQYLMHEAPGSGRPADMPRAFEWMLQAAKGGHLWARFQVGQAYAHGLGVAIDNEAAAGWYEQAAEGDVCEACYVLGRRHFSGLGVEQNASQGAQFLHRAALQNCSVLSSDSMAMYVLAWAYDAGDGVIKDRPAALHWFRRAAELGHPASQAHLGWLYSKGDGVEQDMDAAVSLYRKAAKQGNARAQLLLGIAYSTPEGPLKVEPKKAFSWIKKAAKQDNDVAQLMLARFYSEGFGVKADPHEATRWLHEAATMGNVAAQQALEASAARVTVVTTQPRDDL